MPLSTKWFEIFSFVQLCANKIQTEEKKEGYRSMSNPRKLFAKKAAKSDF